jgi:hypothetical protein
VAALHDAATELMLSGRDLGIAAHDQLVFETFWRQDPVGAIVAGHG